MVKLPFQFTSDSKKVTTDEYFGGCPHCGQTDGYVNFGEDHWFTCDEHKVRWYVGSNLFSSCQEPKTQKEEANDLQVAAYAEVKSAPSQFELDQDRDRKFFTANPSRKFLVRQATKSEKSENRFLPNADATTIVRCDGYKVTFIHFDAFPPWKTESLQPRNRSHENTDEVAEKFLRRTEERYWVPKFDNASVKPGTVQVSLSVDEIKFLANALEREAFLFEGLQANTPFYLPDWLARVAELREMATRR